MTPPSTPPAPDDGVSVDTADSSATPNLHLDQDLSGDELYTRMYDRLVLHIYIIIFVYYSLYYNWYYIVYIIVGIL